MAQQAYRVMSHLNRNIRKSSVTSTKSRHLTVGMLLALPRKQVSAVQRSGYFSLSSVCSSWLAMQAHLSSYLAHTRLARETLLRLAPARVLPSAAIKMLVPLLARAHLVFPVRVPSPL